MEIAKTPQPPYYAVIFSSIRTEEDNGYSQMGDRMVELATEQPGFLGFESVREGLGITLSYWENLDSIKRWKENSEHLFAQEKGKSKWYRKYKIRICKVERDYEFEN
jgi:heme-degrading monooxygenase HmoA